MRFLKLALLGLALFQLGCGTPVRRGKKSDAGTSATDGFDTGTVADGTADTGDTGDTDGDTVDTTGDDTVGTDTTDTTGDDTAATGDDTDTTGDDTDTTGDDTDTTGDDTTDTGDGTDTGGETDGTDTGCVPECGDKVCGTDGCGGECGFCDEADVCSEDGQCVCVPECDGIECGADGCGGTCGVCGEPEVCEAGLCVCVPDCNGLECGADGCGGSCGGCGFGEACDGGQCVCVPDCTGLMCGDDGCGGSCGGCDFGLECDSAGQCVPIAGVPGDTCDDPLAVTELPFIAEGSTDAATPNYGYSTGQCPPETGGYGNGSNDVVFAFVPPQTGAYTITLTGDFDSNLYVVTDCADIDGSCVAGDEDACTGCVEDIEPTLEAGTTYFVIVDGFGTASNQSGEYTLTISDAVVCAPECCGLECGDDGCGGSCGECGLNETCDFGQCTCVPQCAGLECGSDGCDGFCGICPPGQVCDAGLCSLVCEPACEGLSCGDDGCGGSCGECAAGEACEAGACVVLPVGEGDTCTTPFLVGDLPFTVNGDTSDAQPDYGYGPNGCPGETSAWGEGSKDEIWQLDPPASGTYKIDLTAQYDSNLYIVTDCGDVDGTCLAADEKICTGCLETVTVDLELGTPYFVVIDGYTTGATSQDGPYTLTITSLSVCTPDCTGLECGDDGCGGVCGECAAGQACEAGQCVETTLPGDTCDDPYVATTVPWLATGDTTTATDDYALPKESCGVAPGLGTGAGDEVVAFTAATTGEYRFTLTDGGYDAALYVVTDCADPGAACLGAADAPCTACDEVVELSLTAGQSVRAIVDGAAAGVGAWTLTIEDITPVPELVINELLADPATDSVIGDANCDGVRDAGDDEFVELVNVGGADLDLSNATIADETATRHVFAEGTTLAAGGVMVVFGGGNPGGGENSSAWCIALPENVTIDTASTGALGFNNGGDTVTILAADGTELATVTYAGSPPGDADQSLVRSPELTGDFNLHQSVLGTIGAQSPGLTADGQTLSP